LWDLEKENPELRKLLTDQMLKSKALEIALEKSLSPEASIAKAVTMLRELWVRSMSVVGILSIDTDWPHPLEPQGELVHRAHNGLK
jgi:hypothetical protein